MSLINMLRVSIGAANFRLVIAAVCMLSELLIVSGGAAQSDIFDLLLSCGMTLAYLVVLSFRHDNAGRRFDYRLLLLNVLLLAVCALDGAVLSSVGRGVFRSVSYFLAAAFMIHNMPYRSRFRDLLSDLFAPYAIFWLPSLVFFADPLFRLLIAAPVLSLPFVFWLCHSRRRLASVWVGSGVLIAIAFLANQVYADYLSGKTFRVGSTQTADYRASLRFRSKAGKQLNLDSFKGKVVVLDTWYSGCGVCFREFPKFRDFACKYAGNTAIVFASLNIPLPAETGTNKAFELLSKYDFDQYVAADELRSGKWGVDAFPTILIFDKFHRLRYAGSNELDGKAIVNNIPALIGELLEQ